ncbi:non-ribosomal peptide synthetase [Legionella sp. PATHC038]|uniref:non-ribosomal peptide synthetase n=1 Tax=Legionella sheltonii TaxID=2992041 RepID=UPI0022444893|nr:non-ribosomal peptide synthetase [Legionella sp. PATHC038]MCW8399469.1 non-ribosomal peptide synthetase [Legionella sp. PATHC038]
MLVQLDAGNTSHNAVESTTHRLNYETLNSLVESIKYQSALIIRQQKKPCLLLFNNNIEYAATFLAVTKLCPVMPMNPKLSVEHIVSIAEFMAPVAIFYDSGNAEKGRQIAEVLGLTEHEINLDKELEHAQSTEPEKDVVQTYPILDENDIALILHTSGTTAKPKCVPLTYKNLRCSINNIINALQLSANDRNLNMMPLFHIHGIVASMLATFASQGCFILKEIDYAKIGEYLRDDKPTWYTAVPTIHHKIYQSLSMNKVDLDAIKLRFIRSCSSALPDVLHHKVQQLLKIPMVQAYGMTESAHQIATNPLSIEAIKFNSVGLAHTSILIVGDEDTVLNHSEIGEVCIQGEHVFSGYINNEKANNESFIHGHFRTGDLGYIDEDGYLFLTGRKKEIINKGGFKISPAQVDLLVLQHPQIKETIAFAIPHDTLGEDIAIMVVAESILTPEDLYEYLKNKLPDYMLPTKIFFVDEIPKSATGKINRLSIAKEFKTERSTQAVENELERELADVWKKILMVPEVYRDDNFFQMGGNSLSGAEFFDYIRNRYALNLQPIELYKAPTIAQMATIIQLEKEKNKDNWLNQIDLILKKYEG